MLNLPPELNNSQVAQRVLTQQYQTALRLGLPLPTFADTGFRVFSQTDEDGLLHYLFSVIGTSYKTCIDLACGAPMGSNTTNLICNQGWHGLLIDADESLLAQSRQFYTRHPDTWVYPPKILSAWVTLDNVNNLFRQVGMAGEIDLLCLDIDGVDYWLWQAIDAVMPRVVLVEYLNIWGPDRAVTVPYRPNFNRMDTHPDFFGASLPAFVKLGRAKGYRLVGCNRYGFNAFFVRNDLAQDLLPEVSAEGCLSHPMARDGRLNRLPKVLNLPWVDV